MKILGFIGFIGIVILLFILINCIIDDWSRFFKVYNAKTKEEINIACQEYQGAYLQNIPVKCFDILK